MYFSNVRLDSFFSRREDNYVHVDLGILLKSIISMHAILGIKVQAKMKGTGGFWEITNKEEVRSH